MRILVVASESTIMAIVKFDEETLRCIKARLKSVGCKRYHLRWDALKIQHQGK